VYSLLAHISLLSAVVAALNSQCLWYICLHYVMPISLGDQILFHWPVHYQALTRKNWEIAH